MRVLTPEEAGASDAGSVVWAVDANGHSLGRVVRGPGVFPVPGPHPIGSGWRFIDQAWVFEKTLADIKADALSDIDKAAGRARLRYVTDVPAQVGVYIVKAEQAAAYAAAGYTGTIPPYVQSEVDSMIAGTTAQQAADTILYLANAWNNVLGPSIECARLKGKRLVTAAVDASGVASELVTAITALNSL